MNLPIKINFRTFLIVAVCVAISVLLAYLTAVNVLLGAILFGIFIVAAIVTAICIYTFSDRIKFTLVHFFTAILVVIFSATTYTVAVVENFTRVVADGEYAVTGRVEEVSERDNSLAVELSGLKFDGKSVGGNLILTIYGGKDLSVGDFVSTNADVSYMPIVANGKVNGSDYRNDYRYTAYVSSVTVTDGNPNIIELAQMNYKSFLTDKLGERYGGIAFGMISGDKSGINNTTIDYFSVAGISHILAVSGMHIGFIVILVNMFLRRRSKYVRLGVTLAILLFYVVFAEFTPSVIRATVMCVIGMFTVISGKQRDILSALCFAFSIILAVRPFYLFEIGFLMSFGSLFCIILFAKRLMLQFERVPLRGRAKVIWNKFGSCVSSSACAQLGISPPGIYFFGSVSTYTIIVNIFVIPLVLVAFICTLLLSVIGWIPYVDVVMNIPKAMYAALYHAAKFTSELPYATIPVYSNAAVFLSYPLLFLASHFTMMSKIRLKRVLSVCMFCVTAFLMCLNSFSVLMTDAVIPVRSYSSTDSVVTVDGKTYVVGDMDSSRSGYAVINALRLNYSRSVEYIIVDELDLDTAQEIEEVASKFAIKRVYARSYSADGIDFLKSNNIDYSILGLIDEVDGFVQFYALDGFVGYTCGDVLFKFYNSEGTIEYSDLTGINAIRSYRAQGKGDYTQITNIANDYSDNSLSIGDYAYNTVSGKTVSI